MLAAHLDYIYFTLGLGLFLLGSVCFSISQTGSAETTWWLLGLFAVVGGVARWLDLLALTAGDSPAFALVRTALTTAGYLALFEFARRTHPIVEGAKVGPWVYALVVPPLLGLGLLFGIGHVETPVRLFIAAPALFWTAGLFLRASAGAGELGGGPAARRARLWAGLYFGAFGLAGGLVVPRSAFLPGHWPSDEALFEWTGVPIQLVRGLLVAGMALSVWALAVAFDPKGAVLRKRRLLFWVMASSLAVLLAAGWLFTDWLGRLHEKDLREEAEGSTSQVQDHLVREMKEAEAGARSASELLARFSAGGVPLDQRRLDDVVDAFAVASDDLVVYLLDPGGTTVASSNRGRPDSFVGKNFAARPYFQAARRGTPGRFIGVGLISSLPGYYASQPVRRADGTPLLVAVVKRNLTGVQLGPAGAEEAFLVSPDGRVLASSRPAPPDRLLWRTGAAPVGGPALIDHVVEGTEWVTIAGRRQLAVRRPLPEPGWSLVVLKTQRTTVANRLLGILITLLVCTLVLGQFVAMQRQFGTEAVVTERRRRAEGRAREFARQADTDALTGVYNRLGFDRVFAAELERARRHQQPLSVVMLDLDHFKRVNDQHGHAAGDQVLTGVARLIETHLRQSDVVARWGGEEFVVLAPMTPLRGAARLAEKLRELMERTRHGPAGAVTGSFGVAELRADDTVETLLQRADQALYAVKNGGRNAVGGADADPAEPAGPGPAPAS